MSLKINNNSNNNQKESKLIDPKLLKGTIDKPLTIKQLQQKRAALARQREEQVRQGATIKGKETVLSSPKTSKIIGTVKGGKIETKVKEFKKTFGRDSMPTTTQIQKAKIEAPFKREERRIKAINEKIKQENQKIKLSNIAREEFRKAFVSKFQNKAKEKEEEAKIADFTKIKLKSKPKIDLLVPKKNREKIIDKAIQQTINKNKKDEEAIKRLKEYFIEEEGTILKTYKVGNKTFISYDKKTGFPKTLFAGEKKPVTNIEKIQSLYKNKVQKPIRNIKQKFENKYLKSSNNPFGSYLKATETFKDQKGNVVFRGGELGAKAKIVKDLAVGFIGGQALAGVLKVSPKIAKALGTISTPSTVLYLGGVPIRAASTVTKAGKISTNLGLEFAGDIGFIAGLGVGQNSFKEIKNTKLNTVKARTILNKVKSPKLTKAKIYNAQTGKVEIKKVPKIKEASFRSLNKKDQAQLLKYYVKKFKTIPKDLISKIKNTKIK